MSALENDRRGFPLRSFFVCHLTRLWAIGLWVICWLGTTPPVDAATSDALRQEHDTLLTQVADASMSTPYLVIDTRDNLVQLRDRDHKLLRSAVAATGTARRFEGPKTWKQNWQFATPAGRFRIQRKVADPLWVKPEWAFLEADEEVPIFAEDPRRFQRGVLGRYALYFAKDLMIHGTLYEVNLGKSITHGCVRIGAEDLQYFYDHVEVGWPVYIY